MNKKIKKELWRLLGNLLSAIIIATLLNLFFLLFGHEWDKPAKFIKYILQCFFIGVFGRYAIYHWIRLSEDEKSVIESNSNQNTSFHKTTEKYFNSLVKEYIKEPEEKNISIDFKDDLNDKEDNNKNVRVLGSVNRRIATFEYKDKLWGIFKWKEAEEPVYTVYFLNLDYYPNSFAWRQTIVHEFTHLFLYLNKTYKYWQKKEQVHDDNFYSHMDKFEDWFDKKWNLTPRQDKGDDWNQHVDPARRAWRQWKYLSKEKRERFFEERTSLLGKNFFYLRTEPYENNE